MDFIKDFYSFIIIVFLCYNILAAQDKNSKPPAAKKILHETKIHGETLIDNYFWLREKTGPEVFNYLKAENAFTEAVMKPTEKLQEKLYKEMLSRIKQTDQNVPYKKNGYYYYTKNVEGKQYPIFCRKKGNLKAKEEITLDMNELARGHAFYSISNYEVSDDANLLAFGVDTTGFRQYLLQVKDLRTGKILNDYAERIVSIDWAADNKTLFYVQEDAVTKRANRLFKHQLGSNNDKLIYEENDELYDINLGRTRSKEFIMLVSASKTTSEVRYLSSKNPEGEFKLFYLRQNDIEYYVDHIGDSFYIRTNDMGKNFRLVTAPVKDPKKENWKEILPHRKDVMLNGIECFSDHFITRERKNGIPAFGITDLKTGSSHYIEFTEPVYSISPSNNEEFNTKCFRLNYQSLITPQSIYDYDITKRQLKLLKREPVLGGYDMKNYKSERLVAKASDGTMIPISIVYKKELKLDGERPLLLYSYGSYGSSSEVTFASSRLSLLDRGIIYAIAHIRGGGEFGKEWYEQGKLMKKKNTFTDFITCAEHLIKEKYTSSEQLIISGGSAGGLLMGAVTNMRPNLFKAVVSYVPFVDVINTMLDETLPLTTQEFLEWGNPKEKEAYDYMKSYSPYDNIEPKNYPTMLIKTSLNDSQVMYWEPAKYVAKLRATKTDSNPLLFKIKLEPGGHGGASGRYDRLKDTAFDYAFMLWQLGIDE